MKLLVVEDQEIMREGLRGMFEAAGFLVVGEAADGEEAIAKIKALRPEIIVLDLELPLQDGFGVIAAVSEMDFEPKIIVLSSFCDNFTVLRLEGLRVHGFVDKNLSNSAAVLQACKVVASGKKSFSKPFLDIHAALRRDSNAFTKLLSDRELQVLALIAEAQSDQEIALKLEVGYRTVETHRFRIMKKLELTSRLELVRYARKNGIIASAVKGTPGSGLR